MEWRVERRDKLLVLKPLRTARIFLVYREVDETPWSDAGDRRRFGQTVKNRKDSGRLPRMRIDNKTPLAPGDRTPRLCERGGKKAP